MPKIELGRIGAVVQPGSGDEYHAAVREIEALGIPTIWITGGPLEGLWQVADLIRNTERARFATGILSVDRFPGRRRDGALRGARARASRSVRGRARWCARAEADRDAHCVYGRAERASRTTSCSPRSGRAWPPFGRDHGAGVLPFLVTPEYTAGLRDIVGDDRTIAVEELVVLETDPDAPRNRARAPRFPGSVPAYQASFRRLGFTQDEIDTRADRLSRRAGGVGRRGHDRGTGRRTLRGRRGACRGEHHRRGLTSPSTRGDSSSACSATVARQLPRFGEAPVIAPPLRRRPVRS